MNHKTDTVHHLNRPPSAPLFIKRVPRAGSLNLFENAQRGWITMLAEALQVSFDRFLDVFGCFHSRLALRNTEDRVSYRSFEWNESNSAVTPGSGLTISRFTTIGS